MTIDDQRQGVRGIDPRSEMVLRCSDCVGEIRIGDLYIIRRGGDRDGAVHFLCALARFNVETHPLPLPDQRKR